MSYKYKRELVENARELRKNMTKEEKHLWLDFLKKLPITVSSQKNIENYIVDFFIASKKIAIEIDGSQHKMAEMQESDNKRDKKLNELGIKVLRYDNSDINKNFNAVCEDILKNIGLEVREIRW